mmetsp:Transcript_7553/g.25963  ORF Transcript_7553/g.25963 Transcript_7553/m.25963 type:complete len:243 (-) Transcript_7553:38-766(-)
MVRSLFSRCSSDFISVISQTRVSMILSFLSASSSSILRRLSSAGLASASVEACKALSTEGSPPFSPSSGLSFPLGGKVGGGASQASRASPSSGFPASEEKSSPSVGFFSASSAAKFSLSQPLSLDAPCFGCCSFFGSSLLATSQAALSGLSGSSWSVSSRSGGTFSPSSCGATSLSSSVAGFPPGSGPFTVESFSPAPSRASSPAASSALSAFLLASSEPRPIYVQPYIMVASPRLASPRLA